MVRAACSTDWTDRKRSVPDDGGTKVRTSGMYFFRIVRSGVRILPKSQQFHSSIVLCTLFIFRRYFLDPENLVEIIMISLTYVILLRPTVLPPENQVHTSKKYLKSP